MEYDLLELLHELSGLEDESKILDRFITSMNLLWPNGAISFSRVAGPDITNTIEISTRQSIHGYLHVSLQNLSRQDQALLRKAVGILAVILENHSRFHLLAGKHIGSEILYQTFFENAAVGIYLTGLDGYIKRVNPALARMHGYASPEEMVGHILPGATFAVHPEEGERFLWLLREKGEFTGFELEMYKKGGSTLWVSLSARIVKDTQGTPLFILGIAQDITKHKQAEHALKESEVKFSRVYRMSPDVMTINRASDDIYIDINEEFTRKMGYTREEAIGKTASDLGIWVNTADRDRMAEVLRTKRELQKEEYRFRSKEGVIKTGQISARIVKIGGEPCVLSMVRDISEKIEIQRVLSENEEKFRSVVEKSLVGIAIIDDTLKYTYVNEEFCRIAGYTDQEMVGQIFTFPLTEESVSLVTDLFRRRQRGENVQSHYEFSFLHKNGSNRIGEVRSAVYTDSLGKVRTTIQVIDITDRKQAEEALQKSERMFRSLAESSTDTIMRFDHEHRHLYVNPRVEHVTGIKPELFIGKTHRELGFPEHLCVLWENALNKVFETGDVNRIEFMLPNGAWMDWLVAPETDAQGRIAAVITSARDITNRKRMEEALIESEQHLSDIIEFLPDATLVIDKQGKITAWNKAMEQMTGYSAAKMIGKGDYEYAVPFYGERRPILVDLVLLPKEEVEEKYYHIKRSGDLLIGETDVPVVKGEKRFLSGWAHPIYDPSGQVIGSIECIRDVTDKRRMEEAIEISESKYRFIAENAHDVIWTYDLNAGFTYMSPSVKLLRGFSVDDAIKQRLDQTLTPESYNLAMRMLEEELLFEKSGQRHESNWSKTFELEQIKKDGSTVWTEVTVNIIYHEEGGIRGIIGITRDITERKKAEELLIQSEEKYRTLVDNMQDVIYRADINGNILYVSPSAPDLLGCNSTEEIIGLNVGRDFYYHPEERQIFIEALKKAGKIRNYEVTLRRRDNGKPIFVTTNSQIYSDKDGNLSGIDGILYDISERKQVEEEKKKLEAQLAQAQKMESIGTLAGGIAHDFNNILSAIIGYSELALGDISDQEKAIAEINEVIRASERAKNLVSQILTFSRKTEIKYLPLELPTLIKESLKMLRSVIPTTVDIRSDIIKSGLVMSDPTQIHQLIMNLCTNAAHAMDETGGILSVSLQKAHIEKEGAVRLDLSPGPYLRFSVSDTGHGMTPEIMERVFEPYFTTKELGRGTGLGLSVVHGIVKSHGGAVTCKSAPGVGTTFDIFLPELVLKTEALKPTKEESLPTGTERILYIDDEPALTGIAEKMLGKLGYDVTTLNSSLKALEVFRATPDTFDLVITDMTMPGMTGDKLAQKFMEVRPDIPVILCTGYSEHISAERAESKGIREYLMKPLQQKVLAETIRKVLDTR
ncbi:MAG TPA: PAS domain S-box protein [Deltaproteobacteria bacterium]|nr:PAS domain S-box protein [Deltaproteobacteria bacterium]HPR55102.1 PAS domain S-box protein [Deltaproteobacteria bacterium]